MAKKRVFKSVPRPWQVNTAALIFSYYFLFFIYDRRGSMLDPNFLANSFDIGLVLTRIDLLG